MGNVSNVMGPKKRLTVETTSFSRPPGTDTELKDLRKGKGCNEYFRPSSTNSRQILNRYEGRNELTSDDPPSVRPYGYKSPFLMTQEGDKIQVWWEGDDKFYNATVGHMRRDGKRRVEYDDGDVRYHYLDREVFILVGAAMERVLAECFPQDARRQLNCDEPIHYPLLADFVEVGHRVQIFWLETSTWYRGIVTERDASGKFNVTYDHGHRAVLRMKDETFRFVEESAAVAHTRLVLEFLGDKLSSQGTSDEP